MKTRNYVAKNMKFNKSVIFKDRKKSAKKGYVKHKSLEIPR